MVLKLYGPVQVGGPMGTILMTLAEKKVPFELVPVDLGKAENKTAEYRALQPFGLAPVIDDDGFILYESRAICRYIAEKYKDRGVPLIPTELKAKALFEQGASVECANFNPYAYVIIIQGIGNPMKGIPTNKPIYEEALSKLSERLDVYEAILGKQRFLGGDEFTLVDVFHIAFCAFLGVAGCDFMATKGPNIARWFSEISSREAWTRWNQPEAVKSTAAY